MRPPILDMVEARAEVERLLEGLELLTYVFTLEPKERGWQVTVECTAQEGWQTVTLPVDPEELRAAVHDPAARDRLRAIWTERLRMCLKREGAS